jgi:cysteine-rich repeat protein
VGGDLLLNGTGSVGTGIILVDEVTGGETLLAEGSFTDFDVTTRGIVFATTSESVIRIDPARGTESTVASGLVNAVGIAASAHEDLYVAVRGEGPVFETGAILLLHADGTDSVLTSGGFLGNDAGSDVPSPWELQDTELDADGRVVVLDIAAQANTGQVFRVDPESGDQTLVPIPEVTDPTGLFVTDDDKLLLSQFGIHLGVGDYLVDPETGDSTFLLGDNNPEPGFGPDNWSTLEAGFDSSGTLIEAKDWTPPTGLVRFYGGDQEWEVVVPGVFDEIQFVPAPDGCGDGEKTKAEECDDGNLDPGDGCSDACRIEACGNERVDFGEACDDGNPVSGDGCDANCTVTACGNDVATEGEECDDGNLESGDGCDANCTLTHCGNGVVTDGEACDDADEIEDNGCSTSCRVDFGRQTKKQRRCIKAVNHGIDRLAKARWKANERCLADAASAPDAFDACLDADPKGKIAGAARDLEARERDACDAEKPPELALAGDHLAGAPAAAALPSELARDLFGEPAEASDGANAAAAKCQRKVLAHAHGLFDAIWHELRDAKADKLAGRGSDPAVNDEQLTQHVQQAAAGSRAIAKAAGALREQTGASCGGLADLMSVFGGCQVADAASVARCAERAARCRACLLLVEADPGVALDCDALDDPAEASCPPSR